MKDWKYNNKHISVGNLPVRKNEQCMEVKKERVKFIEISSLESFSELN